jgi:hypothetical protein
MNLVAEIDFFVLNGLLPPHVERFYQSLPPTKLVIMFDTQPRIFQFSNQLTTQFHERAPEAVRSCRKFLCTCATIRINRRFLH